MEIPSDVLTARKTDSPASPRLEWTMINVNDGGQQGDAHVIRVGNGIHVLIDAGPQDLAETSLVPFLAERDITSLDLVFISHAHSDHYGGLNALLDHDVGIKYLYFNLPDRQRCEREVPWGCDYQDVQRIRARLESRGIELREGKTGMHWQLDENTSLEILYAFDGETPPIDRADINDTSLIMKLIHGGFTSLFTGDLNEDIGGYLAAHSDYLAADLLKIPHHGIEPVASELFLEKVAPRWGLVSTPESFWRGEASARIRNWFSRHDIPVFVSGISGNVSVLIDNGELKIRPDLAESDHQN
ncbi:MAG: MBL fold metallo-hydrolase [Desulfofustis sp.]|jgi:competence protein ComEC